jgi:hypothetical protein
MPPRTPGPKDSATSNNRVSSSKARPKAPMLRPRHHDRNRLRTESKQSEPNPDCRQG